MIQNKKFRKAWKKFWRPILGAGALQWVVAIILSVPVWIAYFTSRKEYVGMDVFYKYHRKPAVFVFWHGRSMMLGPIVRMRRMRGVIIASRHTDGRMMAKLQRVFGMRAIHGSSTKGAVSVLRQGVRVLRDGRYALCLAPDGPSGPSLRIKDGALYFAKMTGAPIIPVCYSASRVKIQKRWDKFLLVLPFSRLKLVVGKPVFVAPNATAQEFENVRKNLEDVMLEQVRALDAEFNLPIVEQDLKSGEFKRKMREERATRKKDR